MEKNPRPSAGGGRLWLARDDEGDARPIPLLAESPRVVAGLATHIREDYASCRNPATDPEGPARPLWVTLSTALERVA